jgi:hypothetical protein
MTLDRVKVSKDERAKTEGRQPETAGDPPDQPNDPRPLPVTHDRHLDVDRVLARSLPAVSDRGLPVAGKQSLAN